MNIEIDSIFFIDLCAKCFDDRIDFRVWLLSTFALVYSGTPSDNFIFYKLKMNNTRPGNFKETYLSHFLSHFDKSCINLKVFWLVILTLKNCAVMGHI